MNSVAEEILSHFGTRAAILEELEEDELMHYGVKRRSGRYPYGSGDDPYQHSKDFLSRIEQKKKEGFTYTDENGKTWTGDNAIAKSMGLTSSEYRRQVSWAGYERRLLEVETAKALAKDGLGATEIGRRMGKNESTIRSLLDPKSEHKMQEAMNTVDFLWERLQEDKMIDVGKGLENELRISKEKLELAIDYLNKAEGCPIYKGGIPQVTNPGQQTNQKVLCLPGTEHKEIFQFENVSSAQKYISRDGGETFEKKFNYPTSLDSKRMQIRYAEEGGLERDGVIELRRGVQDLSLGESRYSQVRIMVDGTHYLKGMAVYSDNMPDGVDVIFNTNKKVGTPMGKVLKEIKNDPDNPFGSAIKDADQGGQYWYNDKQTGERKLGLINKRADEGDWSEWADALPSQFLGKQSLHMAEKQLNLAKTEKYTEFDEICSLENPTIKKHLLEKFADGCDSAAVNLKAAALPGQKYHVITPNNSLKETEIYAPNYPDGTKLALVRYPHGGTFEIPILTVNNKNKLGRELLGELAVDAVGIHSKVAAQLSGADFDGDTVMCIPTHDRGGKVKISSRKGLPGLVGFEGKDEYGAHEIKEDAKGNKHYYRNGVEYPIMKNTGTEMGKISNLITDMTLAGANDDELARAVRHSMVVIDAEKHKLDYKASEIENDIASLRRMYQPKDNGRSGGASTILSAAKGQASVDKRQGSYKVNMKGEPYYDPTKPEGAKLWKPADDLYYPDKTKYDKNTGMLTIKTADGGKITYNVKDKEQFDKYNPVKRVNKETGEVTYTDRDNEIQYKLKKKSQRSTKMAETDDAHTLVSTRKNPMELLYADYANSMKDLGNKARIAMKTAGKIEYSKEAKAEYATEVASLMSKLNDALLNATRERAALRIANTAVQKAKAENPNITNEDIRKKGQKALSNARIEVGSIKRRDRNIDITDREWEAIQKGAISETQLKKILNNTDIDKLRERATPKTTTTISEAKIARVKAYAESNYTLEQIADKLGISTSTVNKILKGKE